MQSSFKGVMLQKTTLFSFAARKKLKAVHCKVVFIMLTCVSKKLARTKLKYLPVEGFFAILILLFQVGYLVSSVHVRSIHTTELQVFEV